MTRIVLQENDRVGEWACERLGTKWSPERGFAFGLERDGELIAGVLFDNWNGASLMMHVAAEPGVNWLRRDFIRVCFTYPFLQLQVHKVLGFVASTNLPARRFDEHLGFVLEATLTGAHPGGDLLVYSMTRDQCKWI